MARPDAELTVEVVYALAEEQIVIALTVPAGSTVQDAIDLSGIGERFPRIAEAGAPVGIYGRVTPRDARVSDGDRVEIYRPLAADAKQARRRRAARPRR